MAWIMTVNGLASTLVLVVFLFDFCFNQPPPRAGDGAAGKKPSNNVLVSPPRLIPEPVETKQAKQSANNRGNNNPLPDLDTSHRMHPAIIEPGDLMFGGLFPVHEKGEGKACGGLNAETGFQRLLAMMYAVEKINHEDLILPGIKIGIHAHDTCQHDIYAMERVLEFIAMRSRSLRGAFEADEAALYSSTSPLSPLANYGGPSGGSELMVTTPPTSSRHTSPVRKPIIAVIGPASSSITTAVASVLRLFQIPQISYAATSTELSDRQRFDYFFRVVPPDNLQAQVMAAVVHSLKWRYVWAIGDEGPYGYKGIKSFADTIDQHVCIGQEFVIPRNAKDKFFDDLVDKLASNDRAKGVVLFCNEANIRRLLQATARRNRVSQFYWLASDSWGAKQRLVQGLEEAADGAITILPQKELVADFDVYMRSLHFRCNDAKANAKNPWLQEYWEQINNCSCKTSQSSGGRKKCPDSSTMFAKQYKQEGLIQFVIDSVYALAHAIRNIQKIYCGETYIGLCSNMKRVIYNGTLVRDFIQNVSFYGISKNHITFNSEGGVEGKYEVYQFRLRKNGTYEYVKTGWWNSQNGLALHQPHVRGTVQTFCARGGYDEPMPVSYCSDPCPNDQGYQFTDNQCCWHCERCHKNQFLNMTDKQCLECPEGQLQSPIRVDQCEQIRFVHIDWTTIWPCIPIGLSCLGLLANIFIAYTMARYNKTAVIKASGRESSVILLTGLTLTFITIILQLLWPSYISCTIMRLGMPVSLTMCYASIFTKTHRIYRIFMPSLNNLIHRPPFISPKSQIIMSLLCTGVSFLLSIVCLTLEPPEVEYVSHNLPETIVRCRIKNTTFFLTFIYDILVIVATTSLAWQVRNIPENFNEAKYIAFLMYSSCVVWVGLMPIYFLMTSNYTVQMTSFLLCITLSALDIILCMFAPKMYVVYTGNEDPLGRGTKARFTYATARQQMVGTRKQRFAARNPAELAMVILKSSPSEPAFASHQTLASSGEVLTSPSPQPSSFNQNTPRLAKTNTTSVSISSYNADQQQIRECTLSADSTTGKTTSTVICNNHANSKTIQNGKGDNSADSDSSSSSSSSSPSAELPKKDKLLQEKAMPKEPNNKKKQKESKKSHKEEKELRESSEDALVLDYGGGDEDEQTLADLSIISQYGSICNGNGRLVHSSSSASNGLTTSRTTKKEQHTQTRIKSAAKAILAQRKKGPKVVVEHAATSPMSPQKHTTVKVISFPDHHNVPDFEAIFSPVNSPMSEQLPFIPLKVKSTPSSNSSVSSTSTRNGTYQPHHQSPSHHSSPTGGGGRMVTASSSNGVTTSVQQQQVKLPVQMLIRGDNNELIHLTGRKVNSQPLQPAGLVTVSVSNADSYGSSPSSASSTRSINHQASKSGVAATRPPPSPLVTITPTQSPKQQTRNAYGGVPASIARLKRRSMFMSVDDDHLVRPIATAVQTVEYNSHNNTTNASSSSFEL